LMVTGETGKYDSSGAEQTSNPIHQLLGVIAPGERRIGKNFLYLPDCPGKAYYAQLRKEFDHAAVSTFESAEFNGLRKAFAAEILNVSGLKPAVEVAASPFVSTEIAKVDGKLTIFLANFKGLKAKEVAQQTPELNVKVSFSAKGPGEVVFLPFLGQRQTLHAEFADGKLTCELPAIAEGAVIWLE